MSQEKIDLPKHYLQLRERYPEVGSALENLGSAVRQAGPLDLKTSHLIQLAAATTSGSEGAVHSHVRQAREAGASDEEIRHTILLLTSTIGYPKVAAALSWIDDHLNAD